ncbi:hypothetical protein H8U31_001302 [Salmonella enterica]|nr:hypothetical protein [Salmonella enterica]EFO7976592.1 hypothetical protein [Salmonella enterica]EGC0267551.1 hypothetical protein [Salmonella enterica]
MKRLLAIAALAFSVSACANTHSHSHTHSEALKHNLHGKTQLEDAEGPNRQFAGSGSYVYADDFLEVVADDDCKVKTVNGFPPAGVKHPDKNLDQVATKMGVTVSVLKLAPNKCDITWMNEKTGKSGILKVK